MLTKRGGGPRTEGWQEAAGAKATSAWKSSAVAASGPGERGGWEGGSLSPKGDAAKSRE